MKPGFLQTYVDAFPSIQGFFTFDAALMFMAYNQLIRAEQIAGDVLEIGVHHGLSAIAIGALAAPGRRFVAVDLFDELQDHNESGSGAGNRAAFVQNMQRFFDDLAFLDVFAGHSSGLNPDELGSQFSFCHIDGGHSPEETYHDLELCSRILIPGGLVALDD
jgi:predicted O-methyltransferase YrrM